MHQLPTICDSTMASTSDYFFANVSSNTNQRVSSTGVFPAMTDFAGSLNFEIILNPNNDEVKKKWLFSEKLKKVFIDINKSIGIDFRWNEVQTENPSERYIRALPVYTQDDWLRVPVDRCAVHKFYGDHSPWSDHVLRCENLGTRYVVDKDSGRRSCITPVILHEITGVTTLYYNFVCKTSCHRGMQRRPVVVIFTLEDSFGNVLGRHCLPFKVCSCLKRDLHREENGKNRKLVKSTPDYAISSYSLPPLPHTISLNSSERIVPCTLKLVRLKREYALHALTVIHNTLLGEYMRNNIETEGAEELITQVERYMNRFHLSSRIPSHVPMESLLYGSMPVHHLSKRPRRASGHHSHQVPMENLYDGNVSVPVPRPIKNTVPHPHRRR